MRSGLSHRWGAAGAVLVVLFLLAGSLPARASDEEAAAAKVAEAEALFGQQRYEAAVVAWGAAIDTLGALCDEEVSERAPGLARMDSREETPPDKVAAEVRERLARYDALCARIAACELGRARCLARLGRTGEACRAVGRALAHDLGVLDAVQGDEALAAVRKEYDYSELTSLLTIGLGHADTGDPVEYEFWVRDLQWRLGLAPGDPGLASRPRVVAALHALAVDRANAEAPELLDPGSYGRLVRLGLLKPSTHSGWAYRHAHLFEADTEIEGLYGELRRTFEQRRGERDGPFRALVAFFPALHLGRTGPVGEYLDYLRERAPLLHDQAVAGMRWVVNAYLDEGQSLPGLSQTACRALLQRAREEFEAGDLLVSRLKAWEGFPQIMCRYGELHLFGMRGLESDAARAFPWFEGAAALEDPRARVHVVEGLMEGLGVEKDVARAIDLCQRAADTGDREALNMLGYYHQYGKGMERNERRARVLFEMAADKGMAVSMESLGILLQRGLGGAQDYEGARRWYRKAVEAGLSRCLRRLGNLAIDARTCPADLGEAVDLLRRATKEAPGDDLTLIYLWSALQLQGKPAEAQAAAQAYLEGVGDDDALRAMVQQMAAKRVDGSKLLRLMKKVPDEETRATMVGRAHFLVAVQALAAGSKSKAKDAFAACLKQGHEVDSTRYTAMAELERLK